MLTRILLGGAALASVYGGYRLAEWALEQRSLRDPKKCPQARRECPPVGGKTPNPSGGTPVVGQGSALDYPWCHRVEKGQSAGSIALEITGDAARYPELLAANAHKPTAISSQGEVNFTSLCIGERLAIPSSWNPWLDQTGAPRGQKIPFPPYDAGLGGGGLMGTLAVAPAVVGRLGRGMKNASLRWARSNG